MITDVKSVTKEMVIDLLNRYYAFTEMPATQGPISKACTGSGYAEWNCCEKHREVKGVHLGLKEEADVVSQFIGFDPENQGSLFSANWYCAVLHFFDIEPDDVLMDSWRRSMICRR